MRPAPTNSWSLLKLKRSTSSSGGARRWFLYVATGMLLIYVSIAVWFASQLVWSDKKAAETLEKSITSDIASSQPQKGTLPVEKAIEPLVSSGVDEHYTDDDIHIVFSTGCNLFQHWQAEVVLFSHLKVGQGGKITRVVSGCDTEAQKRAHAKFLTQ